MTYASIPRATSLTGNDLVVYMGSAILAASTEIVALPESGLLAVNVQDDFKVSFAIFRFSASHKENSPMEETEYEMLCFGSGYASALREMRHTTWCDDGYVFYLPRKLVCAALEELGRWFD